MIACCQARWRVPWRDRYTLFSVQVDGSLQYTLSLGCVRFSYALAVSTSQLYSSLSVGRGPASRRSARSDRAGARHAHGAWARRRARAPPAPCCPARRGGSAHGKYDPPHAENGAACVRARPFSMHDVKYKPFYNQEGASAPHRPCSDIAERKGSTIGVPPHAPENRSHTHAHVVHGRAPTIARRTTLPSGSGVRL